MQASFSRLRQAFGHARLSPSAGQSARHRDIAHKLQISEGELVAAHLGAFTAEESPLRAQRLQPLWPELIEACEALGELMALTRNESCVHEKTGAYRGASAQGGIGLVLGGAIDLRLFFRAWAHGFALSERLADGAEQRSLQFFDASGQAIHKIFLRPESNQAAYQALLQRFAHEDQAPGIQIEAAPAEPAEKPDAEIDLAGFHAAWASLRDTHDFFALLRRFGLSRTQALRLAEPQFAQALPLAAAQALLSRAAQEAVPLMVFTGNAGAIQIHSGPIQRVAVMGPWLNVLDPGFNLHLREDHIAQAWLVRKPTVDGLVCSLELFDAQGRNIAMLFGERKPGQAERCDWRTLLESLADRQAAAAEACP